MREIKFRAWLKNENIMIYPHGFSVPELVNPKNDGRLRLKLFGVDNFDVQAYEGYRDDVKLMQGTGLKDKKGEEIYEGDIIVYEDVSGSGRKRRFRPREVYYDESDCGFSVSGVAGYRYEVMGNIYENPELLK